MGYSSIGILALLLLLISNHAVLFSREGRSEAGLPYFAFLCAVATYYVSDAAWGLFEEFENVPALYIDTTVYFVAMAAAVYFWCRYVVLSLQEEGAANLRPLLVSGRIFVYAMAFLLIVNCFYPVVFSFGDDAAYYPQLGRYGLLSYQIVLFAYSSVYMLSHAPRHDPAATARYRASGFFGLAMAILIVFQVFMPMLPLYAIGYMLGTEFIRTFVIEARKYDEMKKMNALLAADAEKTRELAGARQMAYTDALTHVKSKMAYVKLERELDKAIEEEGGTLAFAIVMCDVNGLKEANDEFGHDAGDRMLQDACREICEIYTHSPVFRIGGDEFAVVLRNHDYEIRHALLDKLNETMQRRQEAGDVVVAAGMGEFDAAEDHSCLEVFRRADKAMYAQKEALKEQIGNTVATA